MASPVDTWAVTLALLRELGRRQERFDHGPPLGDYARTHTHGELIGLRVALGISLGYEAASAEIVPAAVSYYMQWRTSPDGMRLMEGGDEC